jgi:hypothetical protein
MQRSESCRHNVTLCCGRFNNCGGGAAASSPYHGAAAPPPLPKPAIGTNDRYAPAAASQPTTGRPAE